MERRPEDKPVSGIRCWAERLESGRYQGRALSSYDGTEAHLHCERTHDAPEAAELDVMREVERRLLGRA
jgi:hypothetical protein